MALALAATRVSRHFTSEKILMTQGIDELIRCGALNPIHYLQRHFGGDWGDLDEGDKRQNDFALKTGEDRLMSSYQITPELKLWIITEWDRSVTTLLLPSEY